VLQTDLSDGGKGGLEPHTLRPADFKSPLRPLPISPMPRSGSFRFQVRGFFFQSTALDLFARSVPTPSGDRRLSWPWPVHYLVVVPLALLLVDEHPLDGDWQAERPRHLWAGFPLFFSRLILFSLLNLRMAWPGRGLEPMNPRSNRCCFAWRVCPSVSGLLGFSGRWDGKEVLSRYLPLKAVPDPGVSAGLGQLPCSCLSPARLSFMEQRVSPALAYDALTEGATPEGIRTP